MQRLQKLISHMLIFVYLHDELRLVSAQPRICGYTFACLYLVYGARYKRARVYT